MEIEMNKRNIEALLGIDDLDNVSYHDLAVICSEEASKQVYPQKNAFIKYNAYKSGKVLGSGLAREELSKFDGAIFEEIYDKEKHHAALSNYHTQVAAINDAFRNGLFIIYDVVNNPKRDRAYGIAYENGYSAGFTEIASEFDDLVDLIK